MLTPDQIEALRLKADTITDPIIEFLISDITQRISEAGKLTSTAAYQIWRAQNLGLSQRQLKKELRKRLKVSHRELRKLMTQAAEVGYDFDIRRFPFVQAVPFAQNEGLQKLVNAAIDQVGEDLNNLTQTIGFVTHDGVISELTDAYRKSCDFAFTKVITGAQDYNSAIRDATRGLAEKGILTLDYESGVHRSLEAAVRGNVMGGMGLMQEQISQYNHDELGCDGWEISAHMASAPDHEPYQGKQYPDAAFTRLNNSLIRRIGTLNCGHSAAPIIIGVHSPQYTKEELEEMRQANENGIDYSGRHFTQYEATQRQRGLERSIRKQKRRILIDEKLDDTDLLAQDQTRYVILRDEYKRFSEAAGLRTQQERMNIPGFGPKQARAADETYASISSKTVEKSENNDTIKANLTDADKRAIHDYISSKSYIVNEKLRTGVQLTDDEQTLVKNLDAALKKMPTYQGNLQRSLFFDSDEDVNAFLQTHATGTKISYSQYISTTRGAVYNPDGQVQIHIKGAKNGRDISSWNPNELEVLYERGASFKVTNSFQKDGKYYIFMEEYDE